MKPAPPVKNNIFIKSYFNLDCLYIYFIIKKFNYDIIYKAKF